MLGCGRTMPENHYKHNNLEYFMMAMHLLDYEIFVDKNIDIEASGSLH